MAASTFGTASKKRTREERDALRGKISKRSIIVERGVLRSDLMVEPFQFIYDIFRENKWLTLFEPVNVYHRLVREFYSNMSLVLGSSPHFKTKVSGTSLLINPALISEVTGIPLTNGKPSPFSDIDTHPTKAEIMASLNPGGDLEWEEQKTKIPISYLRGPEKLLARIVMQNMWPISRNSEVTIDRAKMIYAIINRVPFCLCTHMVMTMIELYDDHAIALPFGGLITKILKNKLQQIAPNKPADVPGGYFRKGTIMKVNAQLQRFHAPEEQAHPTPHEPQASSSSAPSSSDVMAQLNIITDLLKAQGLSIETINKRLALMETDLGQVKLNVQTTLRTILPEDQQDQVH